MNTIITPTGSYNWFLRIQIELQMVTTRVQPNEPEIIHHKSVTDNCVILNAVNALLTSASFN